ncbi:MAG: serine/threonine protein kinase [Planctomycetes bacterium]|nr:serine/threonine protein kinase [Planctomycetota bacterium]
MSEEPKTRENLGPPDDDATASTLPGEPLGVLGAPVSISGAQQIVGERYRLEHVSGSGSMGRVFVATDTTLQRRVAIKLLHQRGATAGPEQDRVLAEARAMAGLRHPNLCPVYEVSVKPPVPFLVMDWIDGIELQRAWREADLKKRLTLFVKIVEAVAAAHAAGVVHRDLKPANILVDRMGEPIIVDFGLARSGETGAGGSSVHTVGGTPGYAAPEQFDAGQPLGPTVDVYALGAMMFEMLTDRLPFTASRLSDLLASLKNEDPPLPETFAPDAPWPLQRICLVALERDPQRRYPNAHAMAADLRRYLKGEAVAARPSMLTHQFVEQVEQHMEQTEAWRRQGFVTQSEASRLARVHGALLRPESHWILEGRRLSVSQVTLNLGGWFVMVGMTIGMYMTWDALEEIAAVRYLTAWGIVIFLLGAGLAIQRRGELRVALGYQMTACLIVPVAMWLTLRETGWLAGAITADGLVGMGDREWQVAFFGVDDDEQWGGLLNRQVLAMMLAWLGASLGLRRWSTSSAFTVWAVLASALGAVAVFASLGLLHAGFIFPTRESLALLGLWVFVVGAAALYLGLRLNRREEIYARQFGLARVHARDAWPVLTASLLMIGIGLTLMAWNAAHLYTLTLLGEPNDVTVRSVAFMINGCALQALSHILGRQRTFLRSRLAEAIRWVSPSHFLAAIVVLESDVDDGHAWILWLIVLVLASIACCYVSVWKQWRPFLFTGLFYIAVAYFRAFFRAWAELEGEALETARQVLMASMLALGLVTMIVAWRLPAWTAALRLGHWSKRDKQ